MPLFFAFVAGWSAYHLVSDGSTALRRPPDRHEFRF